jgi:hypothetical protein
MPLPAFLVPVAAFIFRDVVIKFFVFTTIFLLLRVFVPLAIEYLLPFLGIDGLTSAFSGLSPGVWYFLDFFGISAGVPLLISAAVTRFLIRRLPVIG